MSMELSTFKTFLGFTKLKPTLNVCVYLFLNAELSPLGVG